MAGDTKISPYYSVVVQLNQKKINNSVLNQGTGREGFQGGGRDDRLCSAQESGQPTGYCSEGAL